MSKFCVVPGVNSKVASNLLDAALKTRTIPLDNPPEISTSFNPANVPPAPPKVAGTLIAFCEPTLTLMSALFY